MNANRVPTTSTIPMVCISQLALPGTTTARCTRRTSPSHRPPPTPPPSSARDGGCPTSHSAHAPAPPPAPPGCPRPASGTASSSSVAILVHALEHLLKRGALVTAYVCGKLQHVLQLWISARHMPIIVGVDPFKYFTYTVGNAQTLLIQNRSVEISRITPLETPEIRELYPLEASVPHEYAVSVDPVASCGRATFPQQRCEQVG